MRVLKAYADAGAMGQQGFGSIGMTMAEREQQPKQKAKPSKSGDSISLSEEARELLATGGASMSMLPQDATYDKQGNVMRQVDNLQADLRALTSQLIAEPGTAGILGRLGSMQSQVTSLRAQV